jgi:hypothetical protein
MADGDEFWLLQFFDYAHLPQHLQEISKPFSELAHLMAHVLPHNPETMMAVRKLLEAKDCAVRAQLAGFEPLRS